MVIKFNRFAILPFECSCCKKYIWLEKYRNVSLLNLKICKRCIDVVGMPKNVE